MKRTVILLSCILAAYAWGQTTGPLSTSRLVVYNASGPIPDYRCFESGDFTTAADGTWTMSIASAGITTIRKRSLTVTSPTATAATSQLVPILNPNVGNTFSGKVMSGTGILLLGASSLIPVTTAATISLSVCGN
jgi:hypothetical protein